MIRDFHIAKREEDIGYYAGYVGSSFMFGRFLTSYFWGVVADRYGRKPVVMFGTFTVVVFNTLFGLSTNYWMALCTRFLLGSLNGLSGPMKAYASEICREEHQALGMSLVSTSWGIGLIIGPSLGGFLAQETLHSHDGKEKVGYDEYESLEACVSDVKEEIQGTDVKGPNSNENLLKNWPLMSSIIIYCVFSLHDMAYTEIFSLWAVSPRKHGGLNYTTDDVGEILAISGHILTAHLKIRFWPPSLSNFPISNSCKNSRSSRGISHCSDVMHSTAVKLPNYSYAIWFQPFAVNKLCVYLEERFIRKYKEQHQRGAANGITMTGQSLFKAFGPAGGGAIFSLAQKRQDASFLPEFSFQFGRVLTSYFWGTVADRYGRKPVILFGTIMIVVFNTLFGLSTSFWMALSTRFLLGSFNCLLGPILAYVTEICREEHKPLGMSLIFSLWAESPRKNGGLSYTTDNIGVVLSFSGLGLLVFQTFLYPIAARILGALMALSIPVLSSYPFIAMLSGFSLSLLLNFVSILKNVFSGSTSSLKHCSFVYSKANMKVSVATGLLALQNNAVAQHQRGTANGLSMTAVSLFKGFGPAGGGALFSLAQKHQDTSFLPALPISSLFPFIYFMIRDFHIAKTEEDIGYYAGYAGSSFQFGRVLTSYFWGTVADRYGRKPVIQFGTLMIVVFNTLFGLSTSFWMALSTRFLLGSFNGLIGPILAYVTEICREEHKPLGMSLVSTAWGVGLIVGPSLGGFLAQETLHTHKKENGVYIGQEEEMQGTDVEGPGSIESIFRNWPLISSIIVYCVFSLHDMAYSEIFSLWAESPRKNGGLSYTTDNVGVVLSFSGLGLLVFQTFLYPIAARILGALMALSIPVLSSYPFIAMLSGFSLSLLLNFVSILKNVFSEYENVLLTNDFVKYNQVSVATGLLVLQNNAVAQHQRGAANGLSMTAVSLFKGFGPAGGGALFSLAQKRQDTSFLPGNQMVFFILNVIEAVGVLMTFKPFLTQPAPRTAGST
ncbi:hypothetical protein GIB67_024752 [Kingdonia uniflora]|uniref:Major facilitator superfamily (MFS) profile domain-containing protein n=1 Tax=Kingdonia uniflora TaxID=39325 RepID=A0A7J7N9S1_9MAGN|nr:hypothetical protein GIB67_024752 [Kingdonia uniflora]